jgi:hypothetical protein
MAASVPTALLASVLAVGTLDQQHFRQAEASARPSPRR